MNQETLADAVGVSTASISQLETGKQGFTDTTLYAIAAALNCAPGDLLNIPPGIERETAVEIPIMGYLGAGAEVDPDYEQVPPEGLDQVHIPFAVPDEMIAFVVSGLSMMPVFKPGAIIIVYREQRKPLEAFYGSEAAVRTEDGRRFIKTITRGSRPNTVTLTSWNDPTPIEDQRLEWIGEIFAVLPPSLTRAPR